MATGYTLSEKIRLGIIGIFLVPLRSILLTGQHQYIVSIPVVSPLSVTEKRC
jgi:hypothetical protein